MNEEVVQLAANVVTEGWRSAVAKEGADLLGRGLWRKVQTSTRRGCDPLAAAARRLLEAKEQAHELVADALVGAPPADWAGACVAGVLRNYAKKVPIPGEEVLAISAHALRIMGIYSCAMAGILNRCRCLDDLAESMAKAKLEEVLAAGLSE
ncbi:unnamed protein product [[Actinomadura] parvosata subsp. kistnae]|uniref:Uncharacterized protein n=1 Tax=[Actinomadura] parvosata subsp. kistnae TaxID=1909395 RepID=A0A1V0ABG5_9ACTN|nr:hypothetical protein [Nonomuraea sp. ATCC 55076]AQZ67554.1 hypothetical protein BKM31_44285 [Nonomuraea sp. ATCC 55076]SPL94170.1 unnamed protein product [Actinomadura parvosata subsp. kistnae]